MELGQKQRLAIVKKVDFGVYLGNEEEKVLLPKKQVPADLDIGDSIEVFLYKDSSDRLIATVNEPRLTLGQVALLEVVEASRLGAFLDWGLEKDLFLPFKEQTYKVKKGDSCLVSLYVDKTTRLCATMKVYHHLSTASPYQKDDMVKGLVYDESKDFGLFVAVDYKYSARIPRHESFGLIGLGQDISARVTNVKEDGKLDLSLREPIHKQMERDVHLILQALDRYGGALPFTDKASPERIMDEFSMSKAAFKRAIGRLLKDGKIKVEEENIVQL